MRESVRRIRLADGSFVVVASKPGGRLAGQAIGVAPDRRLAFQAPHAAPDGGSRAIGLATPGKRVALLGCGAVGSHTGLRIAEMGFDLLAVDKDVVEPSNIEAGRTAYGPRTLGMPKVMALAHTAKERGLKTEVLPRRRPVESFSDEELRAIARGSAAVIAAFDDPEQLFRLNALAYAEAPVVYPGFHEGARSGHVVWTVPWEVACFQCAMGLDSPEGMETLHAEPAIPLDIQRLSETTARVALWLCAPRGSEAASLLDPERNIIFLDNRPSGSAERILAVRLLQADRDPACPICGNLAREERG